MPSILSHPRLCSLIALSALILTACTTSLSPTATAETDTPTPEVTHTQAIATRIQVPLTLDLDGTRTQKAVEETYSATATVAQRQTATVDAAVSATWWSIEVLPTLQVEAVTNAALNTDIYATARFEYGDYLSTMPIDWPVQPFTEEQIIEAWECDFDALLAARYPYGLDVEYLPGAFTPQTACDWAVLAVAYVKRTPVDQPVSQAGKDAYVQAISRNPAYAIASPVIDGYFGTYPRVSSPPIADVPVESILIDYSFEIFPEWDESRTEYVILITDGNTTPFASGFISTPDERTSFTSNPSRESVQIIRDGLTDLIPVDRPLEIDRCDHDDGAYWKYWNVIVYWEDGTILEFTDKGSSLLPGGGPWFVEIDDQPYMQYSSAFLDSLSVLVGELGLPEISFDNTPRRLESCERWFYYHPDYFEEAFPGVVEEE